MNHGDLFFTAHEQLRLDDLVSVTEEVFNKEDKKFWSYPDKNLSYEKWGTLLTEKGYDVSKIKKNKNDNSIRQFFYVGDYSAFEIHGIDPVWLSNPNTMRCLETDEFHKQEFLKENYTMYFFPEWNAFALDFFIRLYKQINTELLWDTFKTLYTSANYGFHMFPEEVLEYVFSFSNNAEAIRTLDLAGEVDSKGYITIYRGVGERSTPLEKALSWTISEFVGERFANYYGEGKVYEAKVKVNKIIDYDNERNEEEIIVRYKDIEELKIIE